MNVFILFLGALCLLGLVVYGLHALYCVMRLVYLAAAFVVSLFRIAFLPRPAPRGPVIIPPANAWRAPR